MASATLEYIFFVALYNFSAQDSEEEGMARDKMQHLEDIMTDQETKAAFEYTDIVFKGAKWI